MKNLTKRTKMLLAICAVVIVVVAAGGYILSMSGTGELSLFGTTGAYIDPPMLCVNSGSTRNLALKNTIFGANWSSGNSALAIVTSTSGKTASVTGAVTGQTYAQAKGALFSASTQVFVAHVCPTFQEIAPNTSYKAVTDWTGGQWVSANPDVAVVGSDGTVYAKSVGTAFFQYKRSNVVWYNPPNALDYEGGVAKVTVTNDPHFIMSW